MAADADAAAWSQKQDATMHVLLTDWLTNKSFTVVYYIISIYKYKYISTTI